VKWWRLAAIIAMATIGIGGGWVTFHASPDARWLVASSGVLFCAGVAAALVLMAVALHIVIEDIRPSVRLRRPVGQLALSHREASMHGQARFRHHPIKFWGVLTLNNRFVFGFMVCDPPQYLTFKVPVEEGE
jgi:hypothetical protein